MFILTVEISDPDFDNLAFEVARHRNSDGSKFTLDMLANFWSSARWKNQTMRVARYKTNLPAILPANVNRPY